MKTYYLWILENGKKKTIKIIRESLLTKEEIRKDYAYLNPTGIDSVNCQCL